MIEINLNVEDLSILTEPNNYHLFTDVILQQINPPVKEVLTDREIKIKDFAHRSKQPKEFFESMTDEELSIAEINVMKSEVLMVKPKTDVVFAGRDSIRRKHIESELGKVSWNVPNVVNRYDRNGIILNLTSYVNGLANLNELVIIKEKPEKHCAERRAQYPLHAIGHMAMRNVDCAMYEYNGAILVKKYTTIRADHDWYKLVDLAFRLIIVTVRMVQDGVQKEQYTKSIIQYYDKLLLEKELLNRDINATTVNLL